MPSISGRRYLTILNDGSEIALSRFFISEIEQDNDVRFQSDQNQCSEQ